MLSFVSHGKLNVVTTTTNLKSLVKVIGGEKVDAFSFSKGTQDPHYLEAKPSYMIKASRADLIVSVGLDLEIGWLPLVIRGARNPKLRPGAIGSFVAGDFIDTLEKPKGKLTRADGDVHPEGNPHFLLDPLNAIKIAKEIMKKLSELDSKNKSFYENNFKKFSSEVEEQLVIWKKMIPKNVQVITYHKTLSYFYNRLDIENVAYLEPKPGVPPTAKHILSVIKIAKEKNIKLAIVENYFDPTVANRVAKDVSSLKVVTVPVTVEGEEDIKNLIDLYAKLLEIFKGG